MNDSPFPGSPYNDAEALTLLSDPLIRRIAPNPALLETLASRDGEMPEETVKRRQSGRAFFYYHMQCGSWRDPSCYELILLAECAPDTVCSGCWGVLRESAKI